MILQRKMGGEIIEEQYIERESILIERENEIDNSEKKSHVENADANGDGVIGEKRPDSSYAWFLSVLSLMNVFVAFGVFMVYGIFQAYYLKTMFVHEKASTISWIGSTNNAAVSISGIFSGPLSSLLGIKKTMLLTLIAGTSAMILASFSNQVWQLIMTQGLIYGISVGILNNLVFSITAGWFVKRRATAVTLGSSGSVLGGMVLVPIITLCIERLGGIDWAFRILGIIFFSVALLSLIFVYPRTPIKFSRYPLSLALLKDPYMLFLCVAMITLNVGYMVPILFFPASVIDLGMAKSTAYYLVIVFNASALLARIVVMFISHRAGPINILIFTNISAGTLMLALWMSNKSFALHIVFYALYGLCSSSIFALGPVLLSNNYQSHILLQANGLFFMVSGLTNLCAAPLLGLIFDTLGKKTNYTPVIIFGAVFFYISGITMVLMRFYCRKNIPRLRHGPL